jgi:hypothetical protein
MFIIIIIIIIIIIMQYELLFIRNGTRSVTFLIHVGWPPHFVSVKPQVYVPTFQGYVPWDGLKDGQSRNQLLLLHKPLKK